jgi:hypothetical protein
MLGQHQVLRNKSVRESSYKTSLARLSSEAQVRTGLFRTRWKYIDRMSGLQSRGGFRILALFGGLGLRDIARQKG